MVLIENIKNSHQNIRLMKRKRTNRLTCERARAFPIEKALAKLGHFPSKSTGKEAWYPSPFRPEAQASFKVSKELNRWYDHGAGPGGNVIDLVCLIKRCPVREALEFLGTGPTSFSFHRQPLLKKENGSTIKVLRTREIHHPALKQYLSSRGISLGTARMFCREVHYRARDKNYFAIGLENNSGGWELRNRYVKNCSSPKDSTHIQNGNPKLIVTEGMFDLLSLMENNPELDSGYDFLVLNSAAYLKKAMGVLGKYGTVELYLDNDTTGRKMTEKLMACSGNCIDRSNLYSGFKDINEKLMAGLENDVAKGRQDVFL